MSKIIKTLNYLNEKKKNLKDTIKYKNNLQEIEFFTKDKRELKQAEKELEIVEYLLKYLKTVPESLIQKQYKPKQKNNPYYRKPRNRWRIKGGEKRSTL